MFHFRIFIKMSLNVIFFKLLFTLTHIFFPKFLATLHADFKHGKPNIRFISAQQFTKVNQLCFNDFFQIKLNQTYVHAFFIY